MSERHERTGERTSEWPNTLHVYSLIIRLTIQVLNGIYEEKKAKCQQVSIEVRKTQHKYIIGQQANNLYEILDKVSWIVAVVVS